MTATEQLRKLLDERGIGWYSRTRELQQWNQEQIDFHTAWSVNGARFEAEEDATEKKLHVRSYAYLLPEQAIAATLGRRTCEYAIKDNMNETEGMGDVWIECSACHCAFDYYADEWLMNMHYCPNCGAKVVEQ